MHAEPGAHDLAAETRRRFPRKTAIATAALAGPRWPALAAMTDAKAASLRQFVETGGAPVGPAPTMSQYVANTTDRAPHFDARFRGAEVSLNGRALGQCWKPPYRLNVTAALQPGENKLEIKVTNQWTSRIAGDRNAPADKKVPRGSPGGGGGGGGFGGGPAPLPVSNLIGPVTIIIRSSAP